MTEVQQPQSETRWQPRVRLLRRWVLIDAGVLCFLLLFAVVGKWFLLSNDSPSVAIGWYRKTADAAAPLAEICLEGDALQRAIEHGLPKTGSCPNGSFPLLKPIYHLDHNLTLTPEGFVFQGKLLANTAPKPMAHDGLPLTHYPYGTYAPQPGTVWAISTFSRDSFDSRYWGPISQKQILCYAKPFLVFPWLH